MLKTLKFVGLLAKGRSKYLTALDCACAGVIYGVRSKNSIMDNKCTGLPFFASGEVIKGFGRGSKQLGIPTANFPPSVVGTLPDLINPGIYYGWAQVVKKGNLFTISPVYKMVMSIGWNPYYQNKEKSMETYIIHKFNEDFYGDTMRVIMLGYIRPEKNFNNVDALVETIQEDIKEAEAQLDKPEFAAFATHSFFNTH